RMRTRRLERERRQKFHQQTVRQVELGVILNGYRNTTEIHTGLKYSKQTTSIFFTNFPVDWFVTGMWRVFLQYGQTVDIFYLRKRDGSGKGFRFVRFVEVMDTQELLFKLRRVWIGTYKLRVALAFNREVDPRNRAANPTQTKADQRNLATGNNTT
ncbi:hypothetical protein Ancab_019346, partial [Ancistrocladus abbreviatus]